MLRIRASTFPTEQETKDKVELDQRATWFHEAVTGTKGMVNPVFGAGQVHMTTKRDGKGKAFRRIRANLGFELHKRPS